MGIHFEDGFHYVSTDYEIVAYGEPGLHCNLPWFAVSKGEVVVARVPATQVTVTYEHKD